MSVAVPASGIASKIRPLGLALIWTLLIKMPPLLIFAIRMHIDSECSAAFVSSKCRRNSSGFCLHCDRFFGETVLRWQTAIKCLNPRLKTSYKSKLVGTSNTERGFTACRAVCPIVGAVTCMFGLSHSIPPSFAKPDYGGRQGLRLCGATKGWRHLFWRSSRA